VFILSGPLQELDEVEKKGKWQFQNWSQSLTVAAAHESFLLQIKSQFKCDFTKQLTKGGC